VVRRMSRSGRKAREDNNDGPSACQTGDCRPYYFAKSIDKEASEALLVGGTDFFIFRVAFGAELAETVFLLPTTVKFPNAVFSSEKRHGKRKYCRRCFSQALSLKNSHMLIGLPFRSTPKDTKTSRRGDFFCIVRSTCYQYRRLNVLVVSILYQPTR